MEKMMDLIERQKAIDEIMKELKDRSLHDDKETSEDFADGYDEGIRNAATRVYLMPPAQPEERTEMHSCDPIERQDALDALEKIGWIETKADKEYAVQLFTDLPSAQPDIKQAAKLLSDFIESCPGGDSYLITPDGEKLRTDWGYAMEGIQLIHDWAERRTDG